jgi:hypothetical protein
LTLTHRPPPRDARLDRAAATCEREAAVPTGGEELRNAAGAVAALLDFAAVGVEHAVGGRGAGWRLGLDQQQLVEAHTESTVSQTADQLRVRPGRAAGPARNQKVVAQPVHFRELQFHTSGRPDW